MAESVITVWTAPPVYGTTSRGVIARHEPSINVYQMLNGRYVACIRGIPNKVLADDPETLLQRVNNVVAMVAAEEYGRVPVIECEVQS